MTGYKSKKAAASAKTIDQVNWVDHEPDGRSHLYKRYDDLYVVYLNGVYDGKKAAQRPWVGLTDEEIADYLGDEYHDMSANELRFFRLGEAATKEKNTFQERDLQRITL